ncbi:hypothetical protein [Sedimentisphaera cyanobacteriorum]|uniref:hypothetical protein n=1 Tax=Sedimentisphaera cyanobacteriorum TaxID=1940790 RepID=UPI000F4D3AEA|nr:hypothetical protein [Sedimentisphaera cyanobacteriorum]
MRLSLSVLAVSVMVLFAGGCSSLNSVSAPEDELIFDRFHEMQISFDTSTDILPEIKKDEMGEYVSENQNSVASWGQKDDGAAIWMNAAVFGQDNNRLARKYAFVFEEKQSNFGLYGGTAGRGRIELEYSLPGDFDDITYANQAERRKEIIITGINMFIGDIDPIRLDSDYVYSGAMLVKKAFSLMMYEIEQNPSKIALLKERRGLDFDFPTFGLARARMLVNDEYRVRVKIKIGKYAEDFENHPDVIEMDKFVKPNEMLSPQPQVQPAEEAETGGSNFITDFFSNLFGGGGEQQPAEEQPEIEPQTGETPDVSTDVGEVENDQQEQQQDAEPAQEQTEAETAANDDQQQTDANEGENFQEETAPQENQENASEQE